MDYDYLKKHPGTIHEAHHRCTKDIPQKTKSKMIKKNQEVSLQQKISYSSSKYFPTDDMQRSHHSTHF